MYYDSLLVSKTKMSLIISEINEKFNVKMSKRELLKETNKIFAFWRKRTKNKKMMDKKHDKSVMTRNIVFNSKFNK